MNNKLSPLVKSLETVYESIAKITEAPTATILVTRKTKNVMGHWTQYTAWVDVDKNKYNEIMISADYLNRKPEEILGTLLHEVAHAINTKNKVSDCSSNGYHNKNFKRQAEILGLSVEKTQNGFNKTTLTEEGKKRWAKQLALITEAVKISAISATKTPKGRDTNYKSYKCDCGYVIRMSKSTYELSSPTCSICNESFRG